MQERIASHFTVLLIALAAAFFSAGRHDVSIAHFGGGITAIADV
ncbi:hypothetical protein [Lonsdalea quercina]